MLAIIIVFSALISMRKAAELWLRRSTKLASSCSTQLSHRCHLQSVSWLLSCHQCLLILDVPLMHYSYFSPGYIEDGKQECTALSHSDCCLEPVSYGAIEEDWTSGLVVKVFYDPDQTGVGVVYSSWSTTGLRGIPCQRLSWSPQSLDTFRGTATGRVYQLVRDLIPTQQGRVSMRQGRSGECLTERKDILGRWTEYCSLSGTIKGPKAIQRYHFPLPSPLVPRPHRS